MNVAALTCVLVMGAALAGCDMTGMTQRDAARPVGPSNAEDPDFRRLDADNDGYLSRSELSAQVGAIQHFNEIDTDKDGRISYGEWQAGGKVLNARSE